jgi:hypothetical protein
VPRPIFTAPRRSNLSAPLAPEEIIHGKAAQEERFPGEPDPALT